MKKWISIFLIVVISFGAGYLVRNPVTGLGSNALAGVYHTENYYGSGPRALILHADGTCDFPNSGGRIVTWEQQGETIVFSASDQDTGKLLLNRTGYLVKDGIVVNDSMFEKK